MGYMHLKDGETGEEWGIFRSLVYLHRLSFTILHKQAVGAHKLEKRAFQA